MGERERAKSERRHLIVSAAVECFLEKGYHQTGVRDIAKKAGISLGNLYNHFSSKDAVLDEIAALEAEELHPFEALLADHVDPAITILRFVDEYLDYVSRPENALIGLEILGEAVRNPAIANTFAANRVSLVAALCALLEAGETSGKFRRFEDTKEMAKLILDLAEGKALRCVLMGSTPSASEREELLKVITLSLGI